MKPDELFFVFRLIRTLYGGNTARRAAKIFGCYSPLRSAAITFAVRPIKTKNRRHNSDPSLKIKCVDSFYSTLKIYSTFPPPLVGGQTVLGCGT